MFDFKHGYMYNKYRSPESIPHKKLYDKYHNPDQRAWWAGPTGHVYLTYVRYYHHNHPYLIYLFNFINPKCYVVCDKQKYSYSYTTQIHGLSLIFRYNLSNNIQHSSTFTSTLDDSYRTGTTEISVVPVRWLSSSVTSYIYTFMPWLCVVYMIEQGVWHLGFSYPDPLAIQNHWQNLDPL